MVTVEEADKAIDVHYALIRRALEIVINYPYNKDIDPAVTSCCSIEFDKTEAVLTWPEIEPGACLITNDQVFPVVLLFMDEGSFANYIENQKQQALVAARVADDTEWKERQTLELLKAKYEGR